MKIPVLAVIFVLLLVSAVHAAQSVITEGEGYSCMGDDKSRKETELAAMKDARRKAGEAASTHIRSETTVKDMQVEKDLISAYTNAQVRVIKELVKEWYNDPALGDCYRVKLKAEVLPDEQAMTRLSKAKQDVMENDPSAPLSIKVWTDRKEYRQGDKIKIYLKGNKPFYGRVVYKDAGGKVVQLLPNPFRHNNYFNGGAVYELPAGADRYEMEVTQPFGSENVTVFASTVPAGDLEVEAAGAVFNVKTTPADIPINSRGIKLTAKGNNSDNGKPVAAEFAESGAELRTGQ